MNINFVESKTWYPKTVYSVEGETVVFSCKFWSAPTGTPTAAAYKNGQLVTTTIFPSGSVTVSSATVTLKPAVFATYGTYVIVVTAVIGTETVVNKINVVVEKAKAIK